MSPTSFKMLDRYLKHYEERIAALEAETTELKESMSRELRLLKSELNLAESRLE